MTLQNDKELLRLKLEEVRLRELEISMREGLPHLYGWKWYKWARKFYECRDKECFLLAANQISKSSTQIRKVIHWATDKSLWPELWPHLTPNQFWYLYPNREVATAEFHLKWKQFLPKGKWKDDPVYGWKEDMERKQIRSIVFNSGVTIFFKCYSQDVQDLQTGTVFYIATDEELPLELLGELQARLNATDGYMSMVFTATIGQEYWRKTMEPRPGEVTNHPDAFKQQISIYDCLFYEDGTPSFWSVERIERIKAKCASHTEMLIRVYGKFAKVGGRKYGAYDDTKNRSTNHRLPSTWHIYSGVDIGSGTRHPAAIVFVAVDPLFRRGRVFRAWRGDGIPTTSGDVLVKYVELRGDLKPVMQCYDYASNEFLQIAERAGENFESANKSHNLGEGVLNTLFKYQMLSIQDGDIELDKLSSELMSVLSTTPKNDAEDDLCDALRYAVTRIPWDFSAMEGLPQPREVEKQELSPEDRRRGLREEESADVFDVDDEFDEWNEQYNGY